MIWTDADHRIRPPAATIIAALIFLTNGGIGKLVNFSLLFNNHYSIRT